MDTIHLSDLFLWGCFFFCLVIWWHLSFNSIICRCNLLWWDKYTDWHWFCGFRDVTEVLFALLFVFFSLPGEERLFEGKVSLASEKRKPYKLFLNRKVCFGGQQGGPRLLNKDLGSSPFPPKCLSPDVTCITDRGQRVGKLTSSFPFLH